MSGFIAWLHRLFHKKEQISESRSDYIDSRNVKKYSIRVDAPTSSETDIDNELLCEERVCYSYAPERYKTVELFGKEYYCPDDEQDALRRLIMTHWRKSNRELCERSLINESLFYKLLQGSRKIGRDAAICLVLALELDGDAAAEALKAFGFALNENNIRDLIISVAIERKTDLDITNEILLEHGQTLLGQYEKYGQNVQS